MNFFLRVLFKALLLFALINVLIAGAYSPGGWIPSVGRPSLYNHLFPGRPRFPFGESPQEAYNFSLFNLDAMFESHAVDLDKPADEFRVILIGDSSVWGTLLRPEETLAGQLDAYHLSAPPVKAGAPARRVRFYNLGYPTLSLTKDMLILNEVLRAVQPDLVIWLTTLDSFPVDKQLSVPLVENNPTRTLTVIRRYGLPLDPNALPQVSFWERTLIGQRKNLADIVRLQLYGVLWSATGIDQFYPTNYPPAQVDLEADPTFHGKETLTRADLAFGVLEAGARWMTNVPLLVVNEPILISTGQNSGVRYNFYYPRAAYDAYRTWLAESAQSAGFAYLDAWDIVPVDEFTNSAIHLNRQGTARLAEEVREKVLEMVE